jgi:hypothetical protein
MKHKIIGKSGIALWVLALAMVIAISGSATAHGLIAPVVPQSSGQNSLKRTEFSLASMDGRYSFLNNVAALAASLGTMTFDGNGNVIDGTATGNTLAVSGGQIVSEVFPFTFSGTYTLDKNGNGHVTLIANLPGGKTQTSNFEFVVFEAQRINGKVIVTELRAVQVEREPNTHTIGQVSAKRLSDS